MISHIIINCQ